MHGFLARLGSHLVRRAANSTLEEALDGLERLASREGSDVSSTALPRRRPEAPGRMTLPGGPRSRLERSPTDALVGLG